MSQNTLHVYRGFLDKHERKLIMGNNGVSRIGEIIASDKYATLQTAINQGFEKINSTYGDKIVDDKNKGIAVESNPNNEPENKPNSVSLKNKKRYERMIKGYIIENGFESIKEKINNSPDKVYTTEELSEDGEENISVTFKLDDNGNITFEYMVTKKPKDDVKFDAEAQKKYSDLGKELVNPLTTPDRKEEIRKEMTELLEQQYLSTVHTKGFGGRNKPFLDQNYKKRAKATVDMTERLAKFNGREVVPYAAATPDFYAANKKLEAEQAEAKARLEKNEYENEEAKAADLAILNKSVGAISGISMSYVNNHKYLFYKDGKFDSEMFKDFAAVLAGEDGLLTVEERKSAENRFMMRASEAARKAQQKLQDNGGDESKLTPEEKDLIIFAMDYKQQPFKTRKAIFEPPLGMVQATIVRDAGLEADINYKPLLTAASIVAAIVAPAIGASLTTSTVTDIKLNLKTLIDNNVIVNATDTVSYYIDEAAGQIIVENLTQGTVHTITDVSLKGAIEGTVKTSLSGVFASNPIAFGAGALADIGTSPAQPQVQQGQEGKELKTKGAGTLENPCAPCPPPNNGDDNVDDGQVINGNQVKIEGCADEEAESPCPPIEVKYEVFSVTDDEARKALGDKYIEGATYKKGKQMWQFYASFDGFDQIKDKKEKEAVIREIQKQFLGGNNALKPGVYKFDNCQIKVGEKIFTFNEDKWNKMKPQVYRVDSNAKLKQGGIKFSSVHTSSGYAQVTITVNGKSTTYTANGTDKQGAINALVAKVPDEYKAAVRAKLENCKNCK